MPLIMKKHSLVSEYDFDFFMIGISCHLKDYRLAWFINSMLEINLEKRDNHTVLLKKNATGLSEFSLFSFEEEENHSQYLLLANHSDTGVLLQEMKQFDFFLIINATLFDNQMKLIIENLQKINSILFVKELNPNTIKSKNNLIFDI